MDTIEQLLQRGQKAQGGRISQALLSAPEAEQIIGQLAPLSIEEVGTAKWHQQHEWIERLNLQAHYNAQMHSDEFVVELLVSLDKVQVLVHDLLVIEAWKEFVYPLLSSHLAERVDSVTAYLLLYHEVTVANLLQVALYHSHAAESLSEDYALEVADWCSRKLTRLNVEGRQLAEHKEHTSEELLHMTRLEEQEEKRREVEFSVMMCSLAILRYTTDALPRLPMGALSRVVSTNDTLMGLLPLLDRPPWVRTRVPPGGGRPVLEKWAGNRWAPVPPADRLKITQTDGQVWLAVTNLLVEPRCRAKYSLDEYRRERILGLKRHLNELMFDQLPVLKDLQRVLDELALGVLPDQTGGKGAALILEAVPVVREQLLRGLNWRQVAERSKKEQFGSGATALARERMEAMVKHLDFLCELEPEPPGGPAGQGAQGKDAGPEPHPPVKVSTWRKVHNSGVYESWYDFAMEVDETRPPEPVEVAAPAAGTSSSAANGGAAAAAVVHGLRYRLRPLDEESTRPLPATGKAMVRWGSLAAEALLQLPELPTRSSGEGAPVLWVTVGLLAVDGVVLQVKLKKAARPKERDRVAGVWYAYHPVAGALTVLRQEAHGNTTSTSSGAAGTKAAAAAAAGGPKGAAGGVNGGKEAGVGGKAGAGVRPLVQLLPEGPAGKSSGAGTAAAAAHVNDRPQSQAQPQLQPRAEASGGSGPAAAAVAAGGLQQTGAGPAAVTASSSPLEAATPVSSTSDAGQQQQGAGGSASAPPLASAAATRDPAAGPAASVPAADAAAGTVSGSKGLEAAATGAVAAPADMAGERRADGKGKEEDEEAAGEEKEGGGLDDLM